MQDEKLISATRARQGPKRNGDLRVLVMPALLLVVVAALLYASCAALSTTAR